MNNCYDPKPSLIRKIIKHTDVDYSFLLDYKVENEPGKFVMVSVPGVGEIPISISGFSPEGIELTIRNVGKVTNEIFKTKPGGHLYVRGSYGTTFPVDRLFGKHLLVIAGGSGVAAVKPLVEYFHKPNECTLKELDILVGFKSTKHLLFKKEIKEWKAWSKRCNIVLTVDTHEDEEEEWKGHIGFVTEYIRHVKNLSSEVHCIVIGPPLMMTATTHELFKHNITPDKIWFSFERHMQCGVGKCGHCRIRDKYVCLDGPVFTYNEVKELID